MRRTAETLHREEDRLVLQPAVVKIEVPVAHVKREAVALVVHDRLEASFDCRALRDRLQVVARERRLGFDPRTRRRRVDALQRPVRIRDLQSIVGIHRTVGRRLWIREAAGSGAAGRGRKERRR